MKTLLKFISLLPIFAFAQPTPPTVGDTVSLGVPNASVTTTCVFFGWVSATNTVTVRFSHNSVGSEDPASGTFRATVTQF